MGASEWISVVAVVIAAGALANSFATGRRVARREEAMDRREAVSFSLEYENRTGEFEWFKIWYTGNQGCRFTLDAARLARWAIEDWANSHAEPGTFAGRIAIRPNPSVNPLPEVVAFNVTHPFETTYSARLPPVTSRPPQSDA